jgi:hypothetical protein
MAAIALNKFRTVRTGITTEMTSVYTCPIGVASVIILSQVTNVSTDVCSVTAVHSRISEGIPDYKFANGLKVPPNDSASLVLDGRLALETNDSIKIQADSDDKLELILSILETAKQ